MELMSFREWMLNESKSETSLDKLRSAIISLDVKGLSIPPLDKEDDGFVVSDTKNYDDIVKLAKKYDDIDVRKRKGMVFISLDED